MIDYREDAIWTVYVHTNTINGKMYVGITSQKPEYRWGKGGSGYKDNEHFWHSIQKYGWGSFTHTLVAEHLTRTEAEDMEITLIEELKTRDPDIGYNIALGGLSGNNHPTTPVYQFDIHGNYLASYDSIIDAERANHINGIGNACKGERAYCHGFLWRYQCDVENLDDFRKSIDPTKYDRFEPVYQFNTDRQFIGEFENSVEASKQQEDWLLGNILAACRGRYKTMYGQIWKFKKDVPIIEDFENDKSELYPVYTNPVLQFDYDGNLIAEYPTPAAAAKKYNCAPSIITSACTNGSKTAVGYIWRYKKLYNGEEIKAPINVIKSILQFDLKGNFVAEYKNATHAAREIGKPKGSRTILEACKKDCYRNTYGYVWRFKEDVHDFKAFKENFYLHESTILQFDLEGNLIGEYPRASVAAAKYGCGVGEIYTACNGHYGKSKRVTAGGYMWRFKERYHGEEVKYIKPTKSKPVIQFDLDGKFIARYDTLIIAKKETGINTISDACTGHRKTAGGYVWRYESLCDQLPDGTYTVGLTTKEAKQQNEKE